jgi:hypothetical protein
VGGADCGGACDLDGLRGTEPPRCFYGQRLDSSAVAVGRSSWRENGRILLVSLGVREPSRAGKELLSCCTCEWSMVERAGSSKLSERLFQRECPVVPLKRSGFADKTHDSRRAVQSSAE